MSIIADVNQADNRNVTFPSDEETLEVISGTSSCLISGAFSGTFEGDDTGTYILLIQHKLYSPETFPEATIGTGVTTGYGYSNTDEFPFFFPSREGVSLSSDRAVITGDVTTGGAFSGVFNKSYTSLSGTWTNSITDDSGTFTGERMAGDLSAVHRLSGLVVSDPDASDGPVALVLRASLIGLDVMSDNSVKGTLISLRGIETALSGALSDGIIIASGGEFTFSLFFDPDGADPTSGLPQDSIGGFAGVFTDNSVGGAVIGTSCQLN
ncbi:hypothetical protein [Agaribacter flavus]|uniref:Transferrin-binding protein B C-lobe/N-lobe beta barrel domain-containing protein n=1 Tax=Agaribacter flavus TaxID=1902781 RepID=A0ABV7FPP1_9ALTE